MKKNLYYGGLFVFLLVSAFTQRDVLLSNTREHNNLAAAASGSNVYYIDFASGSNNNSGTTMSSPWKHAPGDPNATGKPASVTLNPGDQILFKSGVTYYGSINIPSSGSLGQEIVYRGDAWGGGKAIIDGSQPLLDLQKCTSISDCGGNPNWQRIYRTDSFQLPSHLVGKDFEIYLNMTQDNQVIIPAQFPASRNKYYQENDDFYQVPPSAVTSQSITDPRLDAMGGSQLVGSYAYIWQKPNNTELRKIRSYDSTTKTITFDTISPYTDRPTKYAIANSINGSIFNAPGQYYINPNKNASGRYDLYVWPINDVDISQGQSVTVSARPYGFLTTDKSNIRIEGFVVQKQSGDSTRDGFGIYRFLGRQSSNIQIINNEVWLVMSSTFGGAISFAGSDGVLVEGNYVHDLLGDKRGISISNGSGSVIRNNQVRNTARTGIYMQQMTDSSITSNTVDDSVSTHGNGITVYLDSNNITVSSNRVTNSNIAFTTENSSNLTVINNIFDGSGVTDKVFADWGGMTGVNKIVNNTIVGSDINNSALHIASKNNVTYLVENNIIDGGGDSGAPGASYKNNIYVGLSWNQSARYGWSLKAGEKVETNLDTIFVNPRGGNYNVNPAYSEYGANLNDNSKNTYNQTPTPSTPPQTTDPKELVFLPLIPVPPVTPKENPIKDLVPAEKPTQPVTVTDALNKLKPIDFSKTLAPGAKGEHVTGLQMFLQKLGFYNYPEFTTFYGNVTTQAVKNYQNANSLEQVGSVGPKTRALIESNKDAVVENSTPVKTQTTSTDVYLPPVLEVSSLSDVISLQRFLNQNGFTIAVSGPGSKGRENGVFGPATRNALKRFQGFYGIQPANGDYNQVTREKVKLLR